MPALTELKRMVDELKAKGVTPLSLEQSGRTQEAYELRIANSLLGDQAWEGRAPTTLDKTDKPQIPPKKKKRQWYPGKPETDEEWLENARKKLPDPEADVEFDSIRSGKSRGLDIQNRLLGFGRTEKLPCGCTYRVDSRGNEFLFCSHPGDCPYSSD